MQLLYVILFWVLFGLLASHFAKKKGRNPFIWFFIGLTLGVFGVLLAWILPPAALKQPIPLPSSPLRPKSDAWLKMWYYLDHTHQQKGPFDFADFAKFLKKKDFSETSFVWGEGMGTEWKRLADLPDILKEIQESR